jgi:hypothetical protein
MGVQSFANGGVDFIINRSALRERVYCDGVLVSNVSALVPRLVTRHRFSAGESRALFEVRTYKPDGWILVREGKVMASQRPGGGYVGLFGMFGVLQSIDFMIHPEASDLAFAVLSTVFLAAAVTIHVLWRRATRGA